MNYVCLDVGSVLCHVKMDPFLDILSEALNISTQDAHRFMKRFQQIHDLGQTTMEDELKDQFHVKSQVTLKKLSQAWNDTVTPNFDIIQKINDIRQTKGLRVALLSNIGVEHAEIVKDKLEHNKFFTQSIKHFSCFVGARKPSLLFYQSFLSQYPDFKGCLYIDDLQENLDASKQFEFKTYRLSIDEDGYLDKIPDIEQMILGTPSF